MNTFGKHYRSCFLFYEIRSSNPPSCKFFLNEVDTVTEPPHGKINKVAVRPAKTQFRLGIRPVWSEFAVRSVPWVAKDPNFLHADSEDSDQTGRMPRLIWVFAGRTCHFVGFVMRRLNFILFFMTTHVDLTQQLTSNFCLGTKRVYF